MVTLAQGWAPRLRAAVILKAVLALGAAALVGACSAPAVDSSCELSGALDEIGHIVSESGLVMDSVEIAVCADSWTDVVATISGSPSGPTSDPFLFREDADMVVLVAPETACENVAGNPEGLPVVPEQLRAQVCVS